MPPPLSFQLDPSAATTENSAEAASPVESRARTIGAKAHCSLSSQLSDALEPDENDRKDSCDIACLDWVTEFDLPHNDDDDVVSPAADADALLLDALDSDF